MNKRVLIILICVCSFLQLINAQKGITTYNQFKELPSEKVYLTANATVLLTGEYLFYKFYCLNDQTKQPSEISKIGYVELVGEDHEVIFSHKIRLTKSQGQGDFFIPTSVRSGNYKLIAYTRWMKNGSIDLFFQENLAIVNPYQSNQETILKDTAYENTNAAEEEPSADKRFILSANLEEYQKKTKVALSLRNFRGASGYGNYSISVRKKNDLGVLPKYSPESYMKWHQKQRKENAVFYEKILYAPELDGELIKGKLEANSPEFSVENKKIAVSIPGKDFQLKVIRTDSSGIFHVNISRDYMEPYAIFQVLDTNRQNYKIRILEDLPLDYDLLKFGNFHIDAKMEQALVSKSVYNQIENGFFTKKPDTIQLDRPNDPYGGAFIETVNLGEYTRFKTLDETIVELIPNVWTKKNRDNVSVFKVRSFDDTYEESEFDALVYIDGVFIANPHEILEFDTRTVARINTVREKYRLGGKTYFGMVSIETNNGTYFDELVGEGYTKYAMNSVKPVKKHFRQVHNEQTNVRIPDYRSQLLWEPAITFNGKERDFSFYTSEVAGEYEVVLEGFSIYGRPVTVKTSFRVLE